MYFDSWSKEKAVNYMMNYTSMTAEIVSNDVDRYITWPGQACAYKIGEIKIKAIRQKAIDTLGNV